jgi:hypothetical protein
VNRLLSERQGRTAKRLRNLGDCRPERERAREGTGTAGSVPRRLGSSRSDPETSSRECLLHKRTYSSLLVHRQHQLISVQQTPSLQLQLLCLWALQIAGLRAPMASSTALAAILLVLAVAVQSARGNIPAVVAVATLIISLYYSCTL